MEKYRKEEAKTLLDLLEQTEERFRYRTAVDDGSMSLSWHELAVMARRIGSGISRRVEPGSPVPVQMEKSALTLAVMLGALYAGCFYVPINPANPAERMEKILDKLKPSLVVTEQEAVALLREEVDAERLNRIRADMKESDIQYGIFTSGSTGTPKAITVSHGAVVRFIRHFVEIFGITEEDCIGNQAPFDFDVSVKDICSSILTGARLVLIPKEFFSTPPRLLDYLCEKKVTTLIWAVSALTLVSGLKGLDYRVPEHVRRVMFSGEAMPPKHLRIWQERLPGAEFVNLYGPTEITCNCTYYPIGRKFDDGEKIPLGDAFPGRRVFLLDEERREIAAPGVRGEICVAGESLAEGYYQDKAQTEERFIWYPGENGQEERVYLTGDLGYYDSQGQLIFAGRKDFQIKHMGHRIELEEVENAMTAVDGVMKSCCVFLPEKGRITAFYMGEAEPSQIRRQMKEKLPAYMIPSKIRTVPVMPLNKNGKTDRDYFRIMAEKM